MSSMSLTPAWIKSDTDLISDTDVLPKEYSFLSPLQNWFPSFFLTYDTSNFDYFYGESVSKLFFHTPLVVTVEI